MSQPKTTAANVEPPTAAAIEAQLKPYIVRTMPVASGEWRALLAPELKLRRERYWKRRLLPFRHKESAFTAEMKEAYAKKWDGYDFEHELDPQRQASCIEWGDTGYLASSTVTGRMHVLGMLTVLRQLAPRTVLEVGSGSGTNLLLLSGLCPEIEFNGLELTASGVATTQAAAAAPILPPGLEKFSVEPPLDRTAYRRINVVQGSAAALPHDSNAFDLVFSCLALEQMEPIRHQAMAEMARVSRRWVLMVEPFREVNATGLRRHYIVGNNYFQGAIADLGRYGLTPRLVFDDWPSKITLKAALVLAEKTGK